MTMAIIDFIQKGFVGGETKPGLQLVSKYLFILKITSFSGAKLWGKKLCKSFYKGNPAWQESYFLENKNLG